MFLSSFSLLSLVILGHASSQSVLGSKHPAANIYAQSPYAAPYDDGLFTPVEDLSALSADSFTTLGHPFFPNYSVRIKKTVFDCDTKSTSVHLSACHFPSSVPSASAYTGYIDNQARHLFFYFFESRNNPSTDDVVLWINGGKPQLSARNEVVA
jgi:carboxypeptidase C (cathepsin A)